MKQFKGITLVFIIIFSSCGGSKSNNENIKIVENPPFSISKIYSQKWVAGVREGGSGTNVYITFSEVSKGVVFQEIYFQNRKSKLNVTSKNQVVANLKSTLNSDVIMDGDPTKEAVNTPPEKIPFQLDKNEAVISYSDSDSYREENICYFKITNIEEKKMIAYPKSNPKIEN